MNALITAAMSKTMWFGIVVTLLPFAEQLTGPITGLNPMAGAVLGAVIMVLRAVTTGSLADKVK